MKKGLILEGGAMRGLFTAGVIDVMMENEIKFDGAVGVSAGAAFGCNYKSGQIGRVLRYNTRFCKNPRYCGLWALLRTGNFYSDDFCYGEVPLVHDIFDFDAYEKNPMEFYVVCADIESGEAVYHKYGGRDDHVFEWIRASASMPLVSEIVEIEGRKMLDGGIVDSIPVRFFENIGYGRNIAVLTRPKNFVKHENSFMPLIRLKYKAYPNLIKAMASRHEVYNETLNYVSARESAGELYVIRPEEELPLSRVERDPRKLKTAYEIGRETAKKQIEKIKAFLA